jgi:hypothetical protein
LELWDGLELEFCPVLNLGTFISECRTVVKKAVGQQEMEAHRELIQEEARNLVPALRDVQGDPWETINSSVLLYWFSCWVLTWTYRRIGAVVIRLTYGDSVYQENGKEMSVMSRKALHLVTSVSVQF